MAEAPVFKLVVVGDVGSGKSTFIKRHLGGETIDSTAGAELRSLRFPTNFGDIIFNTWDTCGNEVPGEDFYAKRTFRPGIVCEIVKNCENVPIVLCGNKIDSKERSVKAKSINFHRKRNLQYYEISAKSNYNVEKPFLWLARRLTNQAHLAFVPPPALAPPEVEFDAKLRKQWEDELGAAAEIPISDDEF